MTSEDITEKLKQADSETTRGNYNEAEKIANEVFEELSKQNSQLQENKSIELFRAKALLALATNSWRLGKYDAAIEQAQQVLVLSEEYFFLDIQPKAYNILGTVHRNLGKFDSALNFLNKALVASQECGDKLSVARITGNIGNVYLSTGNYDKALEYLYKALAAHQEQGDKSEVALTTGNLGIVYNYLGFYNNAFEYYSKSLKAHEELGEKSFVARITGNIGTMYYSQGMYDKASEYFSKSLALHEVLGEKSGSAHVTGNLGIVYFKLDNFDKALEYFSKSLALHEELGEKKLIAGVMTNIGTLYSNQNFNGYDVIKAEEFMLRAIALSEEIGAKLNLYSAHKTLSELYKAEKRWEECQRHFERYHNIEKEVLSEEAQKLAEKHNNERREAEHEKALAVERALSKATNDILANILPPNITERLLKGEKKIADTHENVSVLFIDIVGFTQLSAKITAGELIDILDTVFTRFDVICKKHGLEKIKTIGDAYMAVCGAPVSYENHAERTALAAIEMLEDFEIEQKFSIPINLGFRIGLHSGSVVAGIIGKNKYSFDLWGDAVNTASRMESHGEEDKIHVSEEFRNSAGDGFTFTERGEMDIKGKGMMKTYFLENK